MAQVQKSEKELAEIGRKYVEAQERAKVQYQHKLAHDKILIAKAIKNGITVTDDEIEQYLKNGKK